ncbi:MAG: hypothetical protein WC860_08850 [Candidatus Margulisiibacteriota bacterium]
MKKNLWQSKIPFSNEQLNKITEDLNFLKNESQKSKELKWKKYFFELISNYAFQHFASPEKITALIKIIIEVLQTI